jgi:hypothetical protein
MTDCRCSAEYDGCNESESCYRGELSTDTPIDSDLIVKDFPPLTPVAELSIPSGHAMKSDEMAATLNQFGTEGILRELLRRAEAGFPEYRITRPICGTCPHPMDCPESIGPENCLPRLYAALNEYREVVVPLPPTTLNAKWPSIVAALNNTPSHWRGEVSVDADELLDLLQYSTLLYTNHKEFPEDFTSSADVLR